MSVKNLGFSIPVNAMNIVPLITISISNEIAVKPVKSIIVKNAIKKAKSAESVLMDITTSTESVNGSVQQDTKKIQI
jgi:hypothetical protein